MPITPLNPSDDTGYELNLLLPKGTFEEPLWKSLVRNLDDFFFPKKQPPLVLESKPIPVKDIWGFYNYKKNGAFFSSLAHIALTRRNYRWNHPGEAHGAEDRQVPGSHHADRARRYSAAAALPRRRLAVAVVAETATNCRPAKASCLSWRWSRSHLPWSWYAIRIRSWRLSPR